MSRIDRKIGRNQSCPCGSGKKHKRCCGDLLAPSRAIHELPLDVQHDLDRVYAEHKAKVFRLRQQQGLGRPIVSTQFGDHRIVAVGKTLHSAKSWKTFHDFLFHYIKTIFGQTWGAAEEARPLDNRHILLRWAHEIGEYQRKHRALAPDAEILTANTTPILTAYLGLAYNLYLMKHNSTLQQMMIARLKSRDESTFHGAYYETFVAATFIKAGYEIAFENEQDGSATHCEFVATPKKAGRKFSVEAKARYRKPPAGTSRLGIRDKLESALAKRADHTRVIFIDVNTPETFTTGQIPDWIEPALDEIRDLENTMIVSGQETPEAYVFVTNQPYQYDIPGGFSGVLEGFNIPEFKTSSQFATLRAAINARDHHADVGAIFRSLQEHRNIPSTFDGEMPQIHFEDPANLAGLKVGNRYIVPDQQGREQEGELEHAIVVEQQKSAYGIYKLADGQRILATTPLSDVELQAYKAHPETFFGVFDANAGREYKDIIDLYDFFFESFSKAPKHKLLELMSDSADIAVLKELDQAELARLYCERLASNAAYRALSKT